MFAIPPCRVHLRAMTVLFRIDAQAQTIARHFSARQGDDPWAGGSIAPGQFAPVLTAGREFVAGPRRGAQPLRMIPRQWGVPPPPRAGERGGPVLSVRNPDSPFWIGNLRNSEFRCLVPATALFEWGKGTQADGKRRAHWFACADQPLFALAGVWKDSEVPSFALLSCAPNALYRHAGRESMPVVLPGDPGAWQVWLNGDWARAKDLLVPYPSSAMVEIAPRSS